VTVGGEPDWSPDGKKLAFVRGGDVYALDRTGRDLRRITRTKAREMSPEFGPEGKSIAFVRARAVYVVDANGGHEHRVVRDVTGAIDWQQGT
jgi:TolB protein